jgi:hypothetical protein
MSSTMKFALTAWTRETGTGARFVALPGDSRPRAAVAQRCGPWDRGERGIARNMDTRLTGIRVHVRSLSDGPAPLSSTIVMAGDYPLTKGGIVSLCHRSGTSPLSSQSGSGLEEW